MNLLAPAALAFALLAVPILLLYLLRMQRRARSVSSTLLWRQVLLDRAADTLWQRLRRNLLLFLQLATLAALVFALAQPALLTAAEFRGDVVVLLDASASMRATDVAPSRFEAARVQARGWIERMSAADRMQLVLVDDSPRALTPLTADRAQLLAALDRAQPSLAAARWAPAVALAGLVNAAAENAATVAVLSDGANIDALAFSALRIPVRFFPVGASGENLSVSALRLRRTAAGVDAFVRVTNHGAQERAARLTIIIGAEPVDVRDVRVPPGDSIGLTVRRLPAEAVAFAARITPAPGESADALADDDVAYAVSAPRGSRRALLVSSGSKFLEQALATLPGWDVTRAAASPEDDQEFDLYVLDGFTASVPAGAGVLYVGAAPHFDPTGYFTDTRLLRVENHPLLDGVDWRPVAVQGAQRIDAPPWLRPILLTEGGPLLYAGVDAAGRRAALLPFPLSRSDLPLRIAFPILIANTAEWLAPAQGLDLPAGAQPGEAIPLPTGATVTLPDGSTRVADAAGFAETTQAGAYLVEAGAVRGVFAVNFDAARESNITPSPLTSSPLSSSPLTPDPSPLSPYSLAPFLAAAALVLLTIEWWVDRRGVRSAQR